MCFQNSKSFPNQVKDWERNLKCFIVQSFKKIRSRKRKFCETEVGKLLEERKQIKLDLKNNPSDHIENKKTVIEGKIFEATEQEYKKKIQDTLGHVITAEVGCINTHGLWKAKQNIIPKDKVNNPIALKDHRGNLITCSEGIKKLCIEDMIEG